MRQRGEIEFWNETSYGFIRPDAGGDDLFFHITELPEGSVPRRGDKVSFDTIADQRKPDKLRAVNMQFVGDNKTAAEGLYMRSDESAVKYGG
jgi:cold shock CspA family protein